MTPLDFASLVEPLSVAEFVKGHWERRSMYFTGKADRFDAVFDRARFIDVAEHPSGPHADDPRRLKAGFRMCNGEHAELSIAAPQIDALLSAGMTIQAEWLHESDDALAEVVSTLRRSLAVPVEIDVAAFLSPEGSGYALHFDTTSMFVLQLQGSKRWHYGAEPAVRRPVANVIPDANARAGGIHGFDEQNLIVQELSPGDVLYLPAGTWHHVCATRESLHVCLTLRPVNVLDLARGPLLDALLVDENARSLPERPGTLTRDANGRARAEAWFARRLEALREAVAHLTPTQLADLWLNDGTPGLEDVFVRALTVRVRRVKGSDGTRGLQVLHDDIVLATLPIEAEHFLKALAASERFRARDAWSWEPTFAWSDVAMLLRELVLLGVLRYA
jgi:hypothetical protein